MDALLNAEWDISDAMGICNLALLFSSVSLDNFDFTCTRFTELLLRQRDCLDNARQTVLMWLCCDNPVLLVHEWALVLVERLGGRTCRRELTALIYIFKSSPRKAIDFRTQAFRALWDVEKGVSIEQLREHVRARPDLRQRLIAAVPDAAVLYRKGLFS